MSQVPAPKSQHSAIKRTKTYEGCWTCRARRVKCDRGRPHCQRCVKAKFTCDGYGIRLSWGSISPGDKTQRVEKNRIRFPDADMLNPIYSEQAIESALETLDQDPVSPRGLTAGPYTVFPVVTCNQLTVPTVDCASPSNNWAPSDKLPLQTSTTSSQSVAQVTADLNGRSTEMSRPVGLGALFRGPDFHGRRDEICMKAIQRKLTPFIQPFIESSSTEERRLFRFYITTASSLMIATGHPDNPFRQVLVPLAMSALGSMCRPVANLALLHGIYALAASNLAQLESANDALRSREMATKHYQTSLGYLRHSLSNGSIEEQGATLGTIVLIIILDIVNGESHKWRIHLRGGRDWLRSLSTSWHNIPDNQIIYQVFRFLEIVGHAHDQSVSHPNDIHPQDLKERALEEIFSGTPNGQEKNIYYLDRFFGITKPILDIIWAVKHCNTHGYNPPSEECNALDEKVLTADPSNMKFQCSTESLEQLTRHHACTFYFASVIFYQRSLKKQTPSQVQHLVQQALAHFEAVIHSETALNLIACGFLWPLFVMASEAEDPVLRERCQKVFASRKRQGIMSVNRTEDVVREVWRRRDCSSFPGEVHRHVVMEELGVDILLA